MNKKRLLTMMLTLMCETLAWCATFTAEISNGITMQFKVISEDEKTCMVKDYGAIPKATTGEIAIPSVANGYTVKKIGEYAFENCKSITSVTIPEGVTTIGWCAFSGCTSVMSIGIPTTVNEIAGLAFYNCTSLVNVSLPEGLQILADHAFCNAESIESITVPSTVQAVDLGVFKGCKNLKSVRIQEGVSSIGESSFKDCTNLISISIPNTVTSIGSEAFENCSKMEEIVLPDMITTIDYMTFDGCSSLKSITIPDKVTTIGYNSFKNCVSLQAVDLPEGLKTIGSGVFDGCTSLTEITFPSTIVSMGNFNKSTALKKVTLLSSEIGAWFKNNTIIEEVVLGENVTSIANSAFYECTNLLSIHLTKNVTAIGSNAFRNCASLKNVGTVNTPTVGTWFQGLEKLESITLGDAVTSIEASAFKGCSSLENITLPASITSIGLWAFSGCNSLKRVYSQIKTPFATSAFDSSTPTVLIVPKGTKSDYRSVSGWKNLVVFEEGEKIYDKKQTDEQGVCYTLYQDNNGYYYNVTGHTDGLQTEITIPSMIDGCKINQVEWNAFNDCTNLTKVTFSDGLSGISFGAFSGCIALKEYVSLIENPLKTSVSVPDEIYNRAHLIVPAGTKESYLKAYDWYNFYIFEEGEAVMNYDRYITDEQGLTYQIGQNTNTFYYSVTGHGDVLPERVVIPETLNGLPVTEASNYALFEDCTNLRYVSIPKTMKTPYNGWYRFFSGCEHLTLAINQPKINVSSGGNYDDYLYAVELGEDVDTLEYHAFYGCKNLARVSFPERMDTIAQEAFAYCTSLTSISLPKGMKILKNQIFQGCTALTTISLNEELTSIGSNAFRGCTALTTISFNEGLTSIDNNAFSGCTSLHDITLPESLTTLGSNAFEDCTSLKAITIPKNIVMPTSIRSTRNYPFTGCTGLNTITIHAATFGSWFYNFTNIKNVYIGSEVTAYSNGLTGCTGVEVIEVDAANTVFDSRNGCNALVKTATNGLVRGCNTTTIPETVTSIAENAFKGCTELTEITFPAGLTQISGNSFAGCTGLQNITSYIKRPFSISAFDYETLAQAKLTIPFGCTYFYQQAGGWGFQNIEEMEGSGDEVNFIQFADATTKQVCVSMWDVNKDGEISIEEAKQVTTIGRFSNYPGYDSMTSFDELRFFTNVTTVGERAFNSCKALTSITLPESVTSIGNNAFYGCESLMSVNIPEGVTTIGEYVFQGCKTLPSITLPDGVTDIGRYAFKDCKSLANITLPEGLTTIGTYAFNGAGLVEMTIPSTVTSIGDYALAGNIIHCLLTTPISVGTLMYNASDVLLYVPQGCEQAFSEANGWKDFLIVGDGYENVDWADGQVVVDVDNPGGLRLALIELDDEEILRLKIRGILNSTDLKYLIEGKGKIANLESLDLSDVTLAYDGECYKSSTFSGISDTGFEGRYTYYYLTEEERQRSSYVMGINPKYYYYYYGPNLAGAFEGLPYKHVVMPRNIKKAARNVFVNCKNLQSVEYPGGLGQVEDNAFAGCVRLQEISLSEADSIGQGAFQGCSTLADVGSLERVEYLAASAFENCKRLSGENGILSLALVDSIPDYAFNGCISLGNILLSDKLYYIGQFAFAGSKTLKSITLPASLTTIDNDAFGDCDMLQTVQCTEVPEHVNYTSFYNTPWMKALPVENGVKYWDTVALSYDSGGTETPTSLSFREGTTAIADRFMESMVYTYRNSITKLTLPLSLLSIGDESFSYNNLTTLTLPTNLESIGIRAFSNSQQLTKVTLSEGLKMIGNGAFENSPQLTIVNYNAIVVQGKEQFANSESIEKINVGASVQLLPEGIFKQCKNLTLVKFAERSDGTPLTIGAWAFYGCENLLSPTLPLSTVAIDDDAFNACKALTAFTVPQGVSVVSGGMFNGCTALTSVTLHDGVTTISDEAFSGCTSLSSINLPVGLDSIGSRAFASCYTFTELTIPATVCRLGNNILADCYNLIRLNNRMARPIPVSDVVSLDNDVLANVYGIYYNFVTYRDQHYDDVTLVVPDGSKLLYQNTDGWKKFRNIEEVSGSDITATNKLEVADVTIVPGLTAAVNVNLNNTVSDFTAYQFDLIMPIGFSIAENAQGELVVIKGNRYADESVIVTAEKQPVHPYADFVKYRIVCMSASNAPITGYNGSLLNFMLKAHTNKPEGVYDATLENVIFTQTDGTKSELDYVPFTIGVGGASSIIKGDVNGDGDVDIADAVCIVNHVVGKSNTNFVEAAADANGDSDIDIADAVHIVNYVVGKISALAPRFEWNMPEPE